MAIAIPGKQRVNLGCITVFQLTCSYPFISGTAWAMVKYTIHVELWWQWADSDMLTVCMINETNLIGMIYSLFMNLFTYVLNLQSCISVLYMLYNTCYSIYKWELMAAFDMLFWLSFWLTGWLAGWLFRRYRLVKWMGGYKINDQSESNKRLSGPDNKSADQLLLQYNISNIVAMLTICFPQVWLWL